MFDRLKRNSTYAEQIKAIESLSPALAGIADGVHHEVVGKIGNLAGGVKRTLLENNPQEFVKVMAALIKSGHTSKIFFPC